MSIRHGLLALLNEGEMYGYQLKSEFEARTGSTWPLNVGQVYATLGRLERDGLVEPADTNGGQIFYRATVAGQRELRQWFEVPVSREVPPRDELAIKLAMAVTVPGVDVLAIIQRQRTHTLRAMRDYTRLKSSTEETDVAWLLVVDSLIFQAEAEIRWLDHCESWLARHRAPQEPGPTPASASAPSRKEATR
ncbi:MAG: PadR family transcriptional regulator [Solirubrobacteraceae bacterium]